MVMLKKSLLIVKIIFCVLILTIISSGVVLAEINPELIKSLNEVYIFEIKSMQQCEYHSEKLDIFMPYNQIILDKQETIKSLASLIDNLGADLDKKRLDIEKYNFPYTAVNRDAYSQIEVIKRYDEILNKFGHPQVRQVIEHSRRQTIEHFMFLTNFAQRLMNEQTVNKPLQSSD